MSSQQSEIERLRGWARVWKAKAKEEREWSNIHRDAANYWAKSHSEILGQLLLEDAENERLRQKLAALLIFTESGRIAGHQLSETERDALFEDTRAALKELDDV